MKKFICLFTIGFYTFIQSCMIAGVKGSGVMGSLTRTVEAFTEIESDISADIFLNQGEPGQVRLEGEDNILPLIQTTVSKGRLTIDSDRSFNSHKPIKVFLSVKNLQSIGINGSGNVTSEEPLSSEKLSLRISGSGDMKLAIFVKDLQTRISGSGDIELAGKVEFHDSKIFGSGRIKAFNLQTIQTRAQIAGSGTCMVNASDELDADIAGSGDILYQISPAKLHKSVSGSGDIKKVD